MLVGALAERNHGSEPGMVVEGGGSWVHSPWGHFVTKFSSPAPLPPSDPPPPPPSPPATPAAGFYGNKGDARGVPQDPSFNPVGGGKGWWSGYSLPPPTSSSKGEGRVPPSLCRGEEVAGVPATPLWRSFPPIKPCSAHLPPVPPVPLTPTNAPAVCSPVTCPVVGGKRIGRGRCMRGRIARFCPPEPPPTLSPPCPR